MTRALYSMLLLGVFAGLAFAQNVKIPEMTQLDDNDTFRGAGVTPSEEDQVFEEVASISSQTPDSWESELRVRRVKIGGLEEGLVLQGADLLCNRAGNCQTFVLRRENSKWIAMFDEAAPFGTSFGFAHESSNGIKDFVIAAKVSSESEKYIVYKFDGQHYHPNVCYEKDKEEIKTISCK